MKRLILTSSNSSILNVSARVPLFILGRFMRV